MVLRFFERMELTIPLFQVKSSNCEPLWGDGRKEKINFDDEKCFFDILSFSSFAFLKYFLILKNKQNCWMTKCRKNNYFRRMRFCPCVHRPKGVRNSMISLGTEVLWAPYVQKISKTKNLKLKKLSDFWLLVFKF